MPFYAIATIPIIKKLHSTFKYQPCVNAEVMAACASKTWRHWQKLAYVEYGERLDLALSSSTVSLAIVRER